MDTLERLKKHKELLEDVVLEGEPKSYSTMTLWQIQRLTEIIEYIKQCRKEKENK